MIQNGNKYAQLVLNAMIYQIAKQIGADTLDYLNLENLGKSLCDKKYCLGCFNGVYPILEHKK